MNDLHILPIVASICLLISLAQAWVLTLMRYLKVTAIKKVIKSYRDLVRSHIDYLIMAALVFCVYLVLQQLQVQLPTLAVWLIAVGALYNPFGFILQAIKPDIVESQGWIGKVGVVFGFMPLSIGLAWASIAIILSQVN